MVCIPAGKTDPFVYLEFFVLPALSERQEDSSA